ncbi:hypothetical protein BBK82_27910 [Lentzea guizhouensis]|uniref:Uncharacterized protein n=1 Tax=Lentzea guizhouensis TaxID=1586287 RepID=A0A1B2HNP6_9PSEU|nr:hypothetical protein BBK82_27910 [Lentzea guizhouensis]
MSQRKHEVTLFVADDRLGSSTPERRPDDWAVRTTFYPKRVLLSPPERTSCSSWVQAVSDGSLRSLLQ